METIDLEVSKEVLMKEHRSIHDLLTTLFNRTQLSHKAIKSLRANAKDHANKTTETERYGYQRGPMTQIQKKEKLLKYSTARNCGWNKYGDQKLEPIDIWNENLRANYSGLFDLMQEMMTRQECLIRVVNEYMDLCPIQALADRAAETAQRAYQQIATGLPYRWHNPKITGKPMKGGTYKIKWKLEEDFYYDHNNKDANGNPTKITYNYAIPKIQWYVDEHYISNVKDNKIEVCDIAGKRCFTLSAVEELNHELSNDGVRLFKAIVGYTKIPLTFEDNGYHWRRSNHKTLQEQKANIRAVIHTEERWIAIQDQNGERIMEATGKDKSWAIRTMKQRMKTSMLKKMGLK